MNSIKFPFTFDPFRIQRELYAIANSFNPINSIRIKHDHLSGMHLITPLPAANKLENGSTYRSTPELDQSPYLQSILNTFQCDKLMFRVHNLKAKGKINLHRDSDRGLLHNIIRIHIPVTTNKEVYFHVNEERIQMQNGECWYADITQLHEVENRSKTDRLQLMIDCELNNWWKNILKEHGLLIEELSEWKNHTLKELLQMKKDFLSMGLDQKSEIIDKLDFAIALKN